MFNTFPCCILHRRMTTTAHTVHIMVSSNLLHLHAILPYHQNFYLSKIHTSYKIKWMQIHYSYCYWENAYLLKTTNEAYFILIPPDRANEFYTIFWKSGSSNIWNMTLILSSHSHFLILKIFNNIFLISWRLSSKLITLIYWHKWHVKISEINTEISNKMFRS